MGRKINMEGLITCSDEWLCHTLERHEFQHVKLNGEGEDMSEETHLKLIVPWQIEFHALICKVGCTMEVHVYNAYQTGLFYQKFPNGIYLKKGTKRKACGTKCTTDKAC